MKLISILLCLVFTFCTFAHSSAQEFLFGAKAGVQGYGMSFGDKDLKDEFSSSLRGGYSGGFFVNFPLPENFGLSMEANYSKMGRKINFNNNEWHNVGNYSFIQTPILLRKFWDLHGYDFAAKWYVNIGPNVSYWAKGEGSIKTNGPGLDYKIQFTDSAEFDLTTMYLVDANRWLFGIDVGVGFMANVLRKGRFFSELRFTYGHTYLGKSDSANLYILGFDDDMRNAYRVLNLSFGYAVKLDVRDTKKGKSTARKRKQR